MGSLKTICANNDQEAIYLQKYIILAHSTAIACLLAQIHAIVLVNLLGCHLNITGRMHMGRGVAMAKNSEKWCNFENPIHHKNRSPFFTIFISLFL